MVFLIQTYSWNQIKIHTRRLMICEKLVKACPEQMSPQYPARRIAMIETLHRMIESKASEDA